MSCGIDFRRLVIIANLDCDLNRDDNQKRCIEYWSGAIFQLLGLRAFSYSIVSMSLRRYACRRVCKQYDAAIANDSWISDTVLIRSVCQFATTQRRYGSNVPGPLEARRRLARRRNGYMATMRGAGPPIDPSILFGYKSAELGKQRDTAIGSFFAVQKPSSTLKYSHDCYKT